ncbi:MAG: NAD(P)H-dependent oxidoreductase subunit E [Rhodospirillales bacterium]|jgi:formate dehydrogenase|nr:NAD(P)H-dependent oxidoreductase subunit E [Rhodospirillales bacterium]
MVKGSGVSLDRTAKRGRRKPHPKGRQLDTDALEEVGAALGGAAPARDLLIEFLHRLQDHFGFLSARHLKGLSHYMGLAEAEVYEVATFYAHFTVFKEDEDPPPPLTVRVCNGIACEMAGCGKLFGAVSKRLGKGVRVVSAPCVGACDKAPVAVLGHGQIEHATPDSVAAAVAQGKAPVIAYDTTDFESYVAQGGYKTLQALLDGGRARDDVLSTIEKADLRGLGGAGFPSARKWRFVLAEPKPRILAVNADEGEPGTFKDRHCLQSDPHRVLEGASIAAWTIEAEAVYIYLRDEYPVLHEVLHREIARLQEAELTKGVEVHLRRGAGSYVCGEESAMLESMEGKRGLPRNRPPYPAQVGLFGRPTLINNVETLFWLRDILEKGADWYRDSGRPHFYSVSGRVKEPGVKLAPATVTARQLVEDYAGGMADGHTFKGYLPGGASGGILPARLADLPLDFGALEEHGCFIGSAAVVILSDSDDIRSVVLNLLRFFEDESCGQCSPCRLGTEKMIGLLEKGTWDAGLLGELGTAMRDASICGLGQAAPNPVESALRFFADEATGDGK